MMREKSEKIGLRISTDTKWLKLTEKWTQRASHEIKTDLIFAVSEIE